MSQNIPLTSSLRQPVRTIFLILLVGAISFAFVSKAVEYIVVLRETERLGGYFRSIGSLERIDGDEMGDISQGAELILGSRYLAYEDRVRYSSGVMPDLWNADTDGVMSDYVGKPAEWATGLHVSDFWFYGTLSEMDRDTSGFGWYKLTFQVDKVLASYPEYVTAGKPIDLLFVLKDHPDAIAKIESMPVGRRYLIRGMWNYGPYDTSNFQIKAVDDTGLWYIPVEAGADVDLSAPAMASIKNDIDILNENQHTLTLVGTADMSAMPLMQQSSHVFYLVDGRWLNHEDELEGRRVIAINQSLADARQLKLGDTISMTLRGLGGYILDKDRENWSSYPTYPETFEIVGIFESFYFEGSSGSTMAYVPNSALPVAYAYPDDILYSQTYSFVLDSSRHQDAFVNQYKDPLAQLGFNLTFVENNGAAFWAGVLPVQRSALTGVLIYSLVLLLALTLADFLYLSQRRKDYAILRALGVPRGKANRQVLLPILCIGAAGVIAGEGPAWFYALANTAKTFSKLPTPAGAAPFTGLNPLYFIAFCMGLLLLVFGFAWVGVSILAKKPVLELLGRAVPAGKTKQSIKAGLSGTPMAMPAGDSIQGGDALPNATGNRIQSAPRSIQGLAGSRALARFGLRQIGRSGLRSLLTALVALGLVAALGWMQWTMEKDRAEVNLLYASTTVEAEIVNASSGVYVGGGGGLISKSTVDQLLRSGFVQSATLEATAGISQLMEHNNPDSAQSVGFSLLAFDRPEDFFATLTTRDTVQYGPGWDESLFTQSWKADSLQQQGVPALFPESIIDQFNLKLGDVVDLKNEFDTIYPYLVAGRYTPGPRQISKYVIGSLGEPILLPLSALKVIQGKYLYYSTVKLVVDPAKNRDLSGFETEARTIVAQKDAGLVPLKIHFWDEELRTVVEPMEKNLSLLGVLYPVTLAVSVLIGAGLCFLLVLQQVREAALLRTLGVGKAGLRALLCGEQALLSIVGVILGLGLLSLLRQDITIILARPTFLAAGAYLLGVLIGSLIGVISVSNRKPLDLLQVKE
jgi:ABC-type lipoprotein release transport system permease subunit